MRPAAAVEKRQADLPAAPVSAPAKNPAAAKALQHHSLATVKRRANVSVFVNYDRTAAVNYARTYALSYNSAFKRFNNDCTNFVSQSLNARGFAGPAVHVNR